jgi:hypothetical protein
MRYSDNEIADAARRRIAWVFGVDRVKVEQCFGKDLVGRGKSDFKYGEFNQILNDIRDVADPRTIRDLDSGALEIRTVDDYCNHMMRCYRTNESAVVNTLGLQSQRELQARRE